MGKVTKTKLDEKAAEQAALRAADKHRKATGKFIRCYVFREATNTDSAWGWCLDLDETYCGVRAGTIEADRRTLREVIQESGPY